MTRLSVMVQTMDALFARPFRFKFAAASCSTSRTVLQVRSYGYLRHFRSARLRVSASVWFQINSSADCRYACLYEWWTSQAQGENNRLHSKHSNRRGGERPPLALEHLESIHARLRLRALHRTWRSEMYCTNKHFTSIWSRIRCFSFINLWSLVLVRSDRPPAPETP